MDAQIFGAALNKHAESFEELFLGHAVFGISRVIHDAVCQLEESAGVKATAHGLGDGACHPLEEIDMRDVVKVDDGS